MHECKGVYRYIRLTTSAHVTYVMQHSRHAKNQLIATNFKKSAYALISWAPFVVESKFMEELQDTLDTVPQNDILLLSGDFNVIPATKNYIFEAV